MILRVLDLRCVAPEFERTPHNFAAEPGSHYHPCQAVDRSVAHTP